MRREECQDGVRLLWTVEAEVAGGGDGGFR